MKVRKSNQYWLWLIFAAAMLPLQHSCSNDRADDSDLPDTVDFNFHIRPILSNNCYVCHGPDESSREADLRLDNYEDATASRERGAAIVPRNASRSLMMDRLRSDNPDELMPPPESKKELTEREIALIEKWIDQGAEWKDHWAFIPPVVPDFSKEIGKESTSAQIDHLVNDMLEYHGLTAAPAAEKQALIRRASFVLTGLPPEWEDVEAFLVDDSEDAFAKVVDQYLASPHFGERWARHWLDLVRYAEAMGHEFDFSISNAWVYRDYVIRAFNQDTPYDLFVKEHLAGDMIENPRRHPTEGFNESIIGTGYLFLGEGKHSPVNTKLEESVKIDNMIDVTSKTFQALTVACAKCHDHKFDPIPTTDYYAMYGMIESARLGPKPARSKLEQLAVLEEIKTIKSDVRDQVAAFLDESVAEGLALQINAQEKEGTPASAENQYRVLADFRNGEWNGWYLDGMAFGNEPPQGDLVLDTVTGKFIGLRAGMASSRTVSPGVQGTLHSPNFIIEHDSIVVRVAGKNGLVRLIVDNFQVIRAPLWGGLEAVVNSEEMTDMVLDVHLAKGHKAYFEFIPGSYGSKTDNKYIISPEDFIEVQWAAAYDGPTPKMPATPNLEFSKGALDEVIGNFKAGKIDYQEVQLLNHLLDQSRLPKPNFEDALGDIERLAQQLYDSTHFIGVTEGEAVLSPVFVRGSIDNLSDELVPHGFLAAVPVDVEFSQEGSGRLQWAEAVTDPENPLTARVIVNRLWHHLFGRGLVETVDNFGLQGKFPSNPALLDFLALKMIEDGWSMKTMIRHIVLTETFQRSTKSLAENDVIDPTNEFLHHFPVRRLEAEAIRDGMLAVSGRFDPTLHGPSVPSYIDAFLTGRGVRKSGPLDGEGRRSIYLELRRNFISTMMTAFDLPTPFSTFGKRNTTNVPAQSLTLMNDPFVKQQADFWAGEILSEKGLDSDDRIKLIYQKAFSRNPSVEEVSEAKSYLRTLAKSHGEDFSELQDDPRIWSGYCHLIFNLKEFIHLL